MSGKSELLTLTPLISARFYLRPGFFDPELQPRVGAGRMAARGQVVGLGFAAGRAEVGIEVGVVRTVPVRVRAGRGSRGCR